jgi:DNA (cytosine-5)-methyltransferase 1
VTVQRPFNVVELYAGTARSVQPFYAWRRCRVAALIDRDHYAAETYRANFPTAPYYTLNLRGASADSITALVGSGVDILLGCPPCQGFSETGSRNPHDPRNSHLMNFARLAAELSPKAIAMENVPLAAGCRRFTNFTTRLEQSGYTWTAGIINAALRGSCQCRHRLVLVAIRNDLRIEPVLPPASHGGVGRYYNYQSARLMTIEKDRIAMLAEAPAVRRIREALPFVEMDLGSQFIPTVSSALSGLPPIGTTEATVIGHTSWAHTRAMRRRIGRVPEGGRWWGGDDHFSHSYGRLHRRGFARTITTFFPNPGSGRYSHPTENRTLTLREAARIQGFPDSFLFLPPYSRAAMLVGNALDAAVAWMIYGVIRTALE